MQELVSDVREAVRKEYIRAARVSGSRFHSGHEFYGVLLEELDEAVDEHKSFMSALDLLWCMIKNDVPISKTTIEQLETTAVHAAAEWAQVAQVCHKFNHGVVSDNE